MSLSDRIANTYFPRSVSAHWLPGNDAFWYRVEVGAGQHEFVFVDALQGQKRPAFDHAKLAQVLEAELKRPISARSLPFSWISPSPDGSWVRFRVGSTAWQFNRDGTLARTQAELNEEKLKPLDRPRPSRRTGEATAITFVNRTPAEVSLFWIDPQGDKKPYGTIAPGASLYRTTFSGHVWQVLQGEASRGVWEAGDDEAQAVIEESVAPGAGDPKPQSEPRQPPPARVGGERAGQRRDRAFVRGHNLWLRDARGSEARGSEARGSEARLTSDGTPANSYRGPGWTSPHGKYLAASQVVPAQERLVTLVESAPRDQVQPRVKVINYLKPGDRVEVERPRLFDLASKREISTDAALFQNPWDISDESWSQDGQSFRFLFNQRGHQVLRVIEMDAQTGRTRALVEEKSPTFIDYSQKTSLHWLDRTRELIWASERDGWNHLYLYDTRTGKVKNSITRGQWVVREVVRVDEEKRQVWLRALGLVPGQDPYYSHLARVNFDGGGLQVLTEGDGNHTWKLSPDGRFLIDTFSRVDAPPTSTLRDANSGKLLCHLEASDASALQKAGWTLPERFSAMGRDGTTDIHGIIIRPSNFDPSRKYPVIEQIYAGPHDFFVPKGFGTLVGMHELADLGFIVVQIDGMGTNWRSKKFHDVAWKNLKDAGFADRIAWMRAAQKARPWMDLSRVGIYGGSAGGQNALGALLFHPNFYKAAAADCGCHDNRMDKIWWNEAWMGWPVDKSYEESSNVVHAKNLTGKLLLTVGELDTNVDPASTMQVADALIRAGKEFELIVFPGAGHGAGGSPYGVRRMREFFVRHLLQSPHS